MRLIIKLVGWAIAIPVIVLLIVAGVSSFDSSRPDNTQSATIDLDVSAIPVSEHESAKAAMHQLLGVCQGLSKYADSIEWAKATTDETRDIWVELEYGWKQWVSLELKVSDNANTPRAWRAWGHHLFYAAGPTGIAVSKETAGYFCDLGHKTGFIATN